MDVEENIQQIYRHKGSLALVCLLCPYTRSLYTYNTFTDTKALFIPLSLPAFLSFVFPLSLSFSLRWPSARARSPFLPFPQDVKNEKVDVVKQYRQLERARDALERKIAGLTLPTPFSPSYLPSHQLLRPLPRCPILKVFCVSLLQF